MTGAAFDHFWTRAELLVAIGEALAVVITIVEAIRGDPEDRVLLFEFLALVTFFLGSLSVKFAGFHWPVIIVWMVLFFGFTFVAAYSAVVNWLRRTKRAG